jgi:hypothetical protein
LIVECNQYTAINLADLIIELDDFKLLVSHCDFDEW